MTAELALSVVAAAELCLKYGYNLVQVYHDFKAAEADVKEKVIVLEAILTRTAVQLEFVKRVAGTMDVDHCKIHIQVLEMLKTHLQMATVKIESVVKSDSKPGIKKLKYLFNRDDITETIAQLEQWQRIFDPTWYLILRISDKVIDTQLKDLPESPNSMVSFSSSETTVAGGTALTSAKSLRRALLTEPENNVHTTLPEDGLDWQSAAEISCSNTRLVPRVGQSRRVFAVDTIVCGPDLDVSKARADAEALAKKLAEIDPEVFGLLSCHGLVKRKNAESRQLASINMIFRMPASQRKPVSLRHHLLQGARYSLTGILAVARQLASAVSFVHACDFVHKNIRPESVLIFPDEFAAPDSLGSAYLVGFDSFRSVNFQTMRIGIAAWDRNLYHHPSRQGILAHENYVMQHDVYSLGVCLLELGLWESLVRYKSDDGDTSNLERLPSDTLGLSVSDLGLMTSEAMQPSPKVKEHLIGLARTQLPTRMGDRYTAVVVTCLTCLDSGNRDFEDEEEMFDEDGVLVGLRFIEKVLIKLNTISF